MTVLYHSIPPARSSCQERPRRTGHKSLAYRVLERVMAENSFDKVNAMMVESVERCDLAVPFHEWDILALRGGNPMECLNCGEEMISNLVLTKKNKHHDIRASCVV
jgi:hypothetical protein